MGQLYYIRHGQASFYSDDYDQLSDLGFQQSVALGRYFHKEDIRVHKIFLGPLKRHAQTLDAILSSAETLQNTKQQTVEGLREHQGFSILKNILPDLIDQDEQIKELVNIPYQSREEHIKHHIRIYDAFCLNWANGKYDNLVPEKFQNWRSFYQLTKDTFHHILENVHNGENVLVVTSGGPKSVACGEVLDLSIEKILHLSSMIYNGSISSFIQKDNHIKLAYFNHISHLSLREERTLV